MQICIQIQSQIHTHLGTPPDIGNSNDDNNNNSSDNDNDDYNHESDNSNWTAAILATPPF
jgi:hypothetical protein